ncbi:FHS family L-fucose permease-like MFS transporter [Chitinophaga skermanii]|uniref:FHS family L-fucose permease-like MFS transporter n=1 Tax=Chitinophaga skermanii TaxID=331697 RepID=A0A327QCC9_9BACT|nr:MFS transporter [Chitinophaga skermanii]RAI99366.1 FHS family L-fucose permease-like MFS transporter [Chitinophaga skermanii]
MSTQKKQGTHPQFFVLVMVFFFWGFVAASNDILIPLFKEKFHLEQWQSQLVGFAFYTAYFVGAIIYFIIGSIMKGDPLNKIGYKNGIIYGLIFSGLGTLIFFPAADAGSFPLLLTGLFIVGLGFALQQIAANPFAIALGDPLDGAKRLNLAGGINNFGATLGPVLVSVAIFGDISPDAAKNAPISAVKIPYLVLGVLFVLVAIIFKVSKLPAVRNDEKVEGGFGALKYPQLVLGMVAIFLYVGVEVSIAANLGEYLHQTEGLDSANIGHYVSLFWGSMMMGRWTAGSSAFNPSNQLKKVLTVIVPYIAFGVYLAINALRGSHVGDLYIYGVCIAVMVVAFFLSKDKPATQLLVFAGFGAIAMVIGLLTTGEVAKFAFISGGLFCSVMWPCIFTLATAGLGKYVSQGSAFLIMMILGGAIVPLLQGFLAGSIGIHYSYIIPVLCFAYLAYFAIKAKSILKSQGIDYESAISGGH